MKWAWTARAASRPFRPTVVGEALAAAAVALVGHPDGAAEGRIGVPVTGIIDVVPLILDVRPSVLVEVAGVALSYLGGPLQYLPRVIEVDGRAERREKNILPVRRGCRPTVVDSNDRGLWRAAWVSSCDRAKASRVDVDQIMVPVRRDEPFIRMFGCLRIRIPPSSLSSRPSPTSRTTDDCPGSGTD